jgi:hypothetical protein
MFFQGPEFEMKLFEIGVREEQEQFLEGTKLRFTQLLPH